MKSNAKRYVSALLGILLCVTSLYTPVRAEGEDPAEPVEEEITEVSEDPSEGETAAEEAEEPETEPAETETVIEEEEEESALFEGSGDYQYNELSDTEIVITKYTGTNTETAIPESIDGKKVVAIGERTFEGNAEIRTVIIPNYVTSIGARAFARCEALQEVRIPESVTSIGSNAFVGDGALASIEIPEGVTEIKEGTFANCSGLGSVTMSDDVAAIGDTAFMGCRNLESITIPDYLKTIGTKAFFGCSKLETINLDPETNGEVETIGESAFEDCLRLKDVSLPESLNTIGSSAFKNCDVLNAVNIPASVTKLGDSVFQDCAVLEFVTINSRLVNIGSNIFSGCPKLLTAGPVESRTNIEYSWKSSIPSNIFSGCESLKEVTIPGGSDGVTSIGRNAFDGTSLTDVYYQGSESEWNMYLKGEISTGNDTLLKANLHTEPSKGLNFVTGEPYGNEGDAIYWDGSVLYLTDYNETFHASPAISLPYKASICFKGESTITTTTGSQSSGVIWSEYGIEGTDADYGQGYLSIYPGSDGAVLNLVDEGWSVGMTVGSSLIGPADNTYRGTVNITSGSTAVDFGTFETARFCPASNVTYNLEGKDGITLTSKIYPKTGDLINKGDGFTVECVNKNSKISINAEELGLECNEVVIGDGNADIHTSGEKSIALKADHIQERNDGSGHTGSLELDANSESADDGSIAFKYKNAGASKERITLYDKSIAITEPDSFEDGETAFTDSGDEGKPAKYIYIEPIMLRVFNGSASQDDPESGDEIQLEADDKGLAFKFNKWILVNGNGTPSGENIRDVLGINFDESDPDAVFTMPSQSVFLKATYTDLGVVITYTWNDDDKDGKYESVTAKAVCKTDPKNPELNVVEKVDAYFEVREEPTCEKDGEGAYSAEFEHEVFEAQTKLVTIPATGHDYEFVDFTWIEDEDDEDVYTGAVANYVCKNDEEHEVQIEAELSVETTPATCEEDGEIVYTATVSTEKSADKEEHTETQETVIEATGHEWGTPEYTWQRTFGALEVTAKAVCKNDPAHVKEQSVLLRDDEETECQVIEPGVSAVYLADFDDPDLGKHEIEWTYVQSLKITPTEQTLQIIGDQTKLTATVSPENATEQKVLWKSENPGVATVDENGVVTATGVGETDILATNYDLKEDVVCHVTVTAKGIHVKPIEDQPYTGAAIKPEPEVYDNDTLLTKGKDYTVTYKNNKKAGTASITIKMKGNYKGSKVVTFNITKIAVDDESITIDPLSVQATGKKLTPVPAVYFNGKKLKNKTDYTVDYETEWDRKSAGTYTITVTGKGNFEGSVPVEMAVAQNKTQKALSKLSVKMTNIPYDELITALDAGRAFQEVLQDHLTVKDGKTKLDESRDYRLNKVDTSVREIGSYSFTIVGIGDKYVGERKVNFKVTGTSLTDKKVKVTVPTYTFSGKDIELSDDELKALLTYNKTTALVPVEDFEIVEDSYQNNFNAGTASFQVKGKGKYTGVRTIKFKINPAKDAKFSFVHKASQPYTKGGAVQDLTVKWLDEDYVLLPGQDYTLSFSNTPAGKRGKITITFKGNFKGRAKEVIEYNVTPGIFGDVTVTAKDMVVSTKKGGYKSTPVVYDINGKKLKAGTDYEKTYKYELVTETGTELLDPKAVVPAGSQIRVTVTGKGSYSGTASTEYRILEPKTDISKYTVTVPAQEYTGEEIILDPAVITVKLSKKAEPLKPGEDYEIVGYTKNINKGTATVTIKGKGGYGGTKTVKFKITQRNINTWWSGIFAVLGL